VRPSKEVVVLEDGYDHVFVHQVGPDQEGFLDFYACEILG
jgi:hypothetical protein